MPKQFTKNPNDETDKLGGNDYPRVFFRANPKTPNNQVEIFAYVRYKENTIMFRTNQITDKSPIQLAEKNDSLEPIDDELNQNLRSIKDKILDSWQILKNDNAIITAAAIHENFLEVYGKLLGL